MTQRHMMIGAMSLLALVGCAPTIKVEAPDKPIEINLNIRIEQEVRVKIDRELDQVFQDNPDIFGVSSSPSTGTMKSGPAKPTEKTP